MSEELISPTHVLSLVAEFDDLNRCNNILNDGIAEEYFLRFLEIQESWRLQRLSAEKEAARLQKELEDSLKAISVWEAKFTHARKLLDAEKKQRMRAEHDRDAMEKQMNLARNVLFNDNQRSKLNDETLEKLAFLNNTSVRMSAPHSLDQGHARLNTIAELNSTGNLLSDQSFSRSEDDLDESVVNARRSWQRHRPSVPMGPPSTEDHPPVKKRRSSSHNKNETNSNSNGGSHGGRVVATTTLTLDRCPGECAANGRITASSVIEGFTKDSSTDDDLAKANVPSTPSKMTKSEYNVKIESKEGGFYRTNIDKFTPSAPAKQEFEHDGGWTGGSGASRVNTNTISSPRGTGRLRQHSFTNKMNLKPDTCTTCGNRIGFAKMAVKCSDCRAIVHVDCKELLPLPCVPNHLTPSSANAMGSIADYTPNVSPMVPALIIHCVNEVEARGLIEVGIYRVPGSEKEVKALKERFMRGKGTPPLTNIDVNVICGCIKDFLRSLREPLVTYSLWPDFVSAAEMKDRSDSEAALYQAISELPQPNRDTLAFMMLHLLKVAECVECKMPVESLAKVFGPTIVRYSVYDPPLNIVQEQTIKQINVMEHLLDISSDYWARFAAVTYSDGSSVVATPPLNRTPSLRPRLSTMPQLTPKSCNNMPTPGGPAYYTPSSKSTSKSSSHSSRKGFFYTPVGEGEPRRLRKFYGSTADFDK